LPIYIGIAGKINRLLYLLGNKNFLEENHIFSQFYLLWHNT